MSEIPKDMSIGSALVWIWSRSQLLVWTIVIFIMWAEACR